MVTSEMNNYQSYRAYTGKWPGKNDSVSDVLRGINERGETIVSVTGVGLDQVWVLIVTSNPGVYRPDSEVTV